MVVSTLLKRGLSTAGRLKLIVDQKRGLSTAGRLKLIVDHRPMMNPVRDQGPFDTCWAFATCAAQEGAQIIVRQEKITLAPQHLIDFNYGWNIATPKQYNRMDEMTMAGGGYLRMAIAHVARYGVSLEEDYPYRGLPSIPQSLTMHLRRIVKGDGFGMVPKYRKDLLQDAVDNQPVIVGLKVHGPSWLTYKKGIYRPPSVYHKEDLHGHAGVLVAYGTWDEEPIWLLRNSWGEQWGYGGHILIPRQANSFEGKCCKLLEPPYYPILKINQEKLWGNALNKEMKNYLCLPDAEGDQLLSTSTEDYVTKLLKDQFQEITN